jgi:hypothetical protein
MATTSTSLYPSYSLRTVLEVESLPRTAISPCGGWLWLGSKSQTVASKTLGQKPNRGQRSPYDLVPATRIGSAVLVHDRNHAHWILVCSLPNAALNSASRRSDRQLRHSTTRRGSLRCHFRFLELIDSPALAFHSLNQTLKNSVMLMSCSRRAIQPGAAALCRCILY